MIQHLKIWIMLTLLSSMAIFSQVAETASHGQ